MTSSLPQTSRIKAYISIIVATIIWAVAGPVIKFTLEGIQPIPFLTYRFGLSAIVGILIFALHGLRIPKNPKVILLLLIHSIFSSTIALGLLFFGLENTTVLEMTIITLAVPVLTSTAGAYFLREHITKREKIGMGIALLGTLFTVFEPLFLNGTSMRFSGNILIFLYIIANILPAILAKKLLREDIPPTTITSMSFIVGFLSFIPAVLINPGFGNFASEIMNLDLKFHLGVWFMAFLSGSLAYYLYNKAQKTIEVGDASVFAYLYPIFSTPLAVLWLGEKITPSFIVGGIIIIIGVVVAELKKEVNIKNK